MMTFEINGYVATGFEPVMEKFKSHFEAGLEHGASFCAQIEGENVINLWGGFADKGKSRKWEKDSLVQFFSATKPMAALAIAMLQDRGFLALDDNIGDLWPEFLANGKEVTIAQALSHQAGVCGFINEFNPIDWLDLHKTAELIAKLEPLWQPKTASGYHPMNYGYIANEICYRVLGRDLHEIFHSDISNALDVDFHIGLPAELQNRHVEFMPPKTPPNMGDITIQKRAAFLTKWAAPPRIGAQAMAANIISTNGFGTTEALASLYGVFANDGFIKGQEIISKSTMHDLTKSRIKGMDLVIGKEIDWACGVMRNTTKTFGPSDVTMGHAGRGGACGFGDAKNRLSVAYAPNQHSNAIIGDARANALIATLYSCL
jgi:CubicO group peptidase (beta-lactamase class C family)